MVVLRRIFMNPIPRINRLALQDNLVISSVARAAKLAQERVWFIASCAIVSIAAFVRFYKLDLKPLHHDEAVNGFFLMRLLKTGSYQYDPANFHGPALYY